MKYATKNGSHPILINYNKLFNKLVMEKAKQNDGRGICCARMTRDEAEALLSKYTDTLRDVILDYHAARLVNPLDLRALAKARTAVLDAMTLVRPSTVHCVRN